jgi:hypothetical protein
MPHQIGDVVVHQARGLLAGHVDQDDTLFGVMDERPSPIW